MAPTFLCQCIVVFVAAMVAGIEMTAAVPDPCQNHQALNDSRRSVGYVLGPQDRGLCDNNLARAWYRFTGAAGDQLSTSCLRRGQCGTVLPIWMNGSHPTVSDGVVHRYVCIALYPSADCCDIRALIAVKNCGSFFVYYLTPTPTCVEAYCTVNTRACPAGKWSATGVQPCVDVYPTTLHSPTLSGPEVRGHAFHFACNIHDTPQDPDQVFEVQWTFDGHPDPNIPNIMLSASSHQAFLPGTALRGHMGHTLSCQVRAFYRNRPVVQKSPWKTSSSSYFAGVRINPGRVVVNEKDGSTHNVTLTSTVPIICDHTSVCCITFVPRLQGPKDSVVQPHSCFHQLCRSDWDPVTKTASTQISVIATKDQLLHGRRNVQMGFEPLLNSGGGSYSEVFNNFTVPPAQIDVEDADTKSCTWSGDPHIHGLESRRTFSFYGVGDYTMYENVGRHLEIQARTWLCGLRRRVSCVCGVAIREKNDVIRIGECGQPYGGRQTSPIVQVASSVGAALRNGTRILRSTDGHHIAVYLPSGTEVKIAATSTSLSVYLVVPSRDQGSGRGICGTFDNDTHNEFTHRDGKVTAACSSNQRAACVPDTFTESWRVSKNQSLFETVPPVVADTDPPTYCSCDNTGSQSVIDCNANADHPTHALRCPSCQPLNGGQLTFLDPGHGWSRRSSSSSSSPLYVDLDFPDPDYDPDQHRNISVGAARWPTPSGITEAQAKVHCQQALSSSQLWAVCQSFAYLADLNMEDCVLDVQHSDSYDFVEAAVSSFLTECQTTLAKDPASYVTDASGRNVLKHEFSSDVCSVFCLRHGTCVRGKCVCKQGYTGDNCELQEEKALQLLGIRGSSSCDVTKRPCRKIFFDVTAMTLTNSLACKTHRIMSDGSLSSDYRMDKGLFLSGGRLACPLPDTAGGAKTSFSVTATNDHVLYSNALPVIVFDSMCLSCDQHGNCTRRGSTCLISNKCFQDGDINPDNSAERCDASTSPSHWTSQQAQFPPVGAPTIRGPDNDFMMTCAVNTSATQTEARFRVTWYEDGHVVGQEVLSTNRLESSISLTDLPVLSKVLKCSVQSFFSGQQRMSQAISSHPFPLTS